MKTLIKKWFINPVIEKQIALLEIDRMKIVNSVEPKMNQQQKANLFCKENEIKFAINILNEML